MVFCNCLAKPPENPPSSSTYPTPQFHHIGEWMIAQQWLFVFGEICAMAVLITMLLWQTIIRSTKHPHATSNKSSHWRKTPSLRISHQTQWLLLMKLEGQRGSFHLNMTQATRKLCFQTMVLARYWVSVLVWLLPVLLSVLLQHIPRSKLNAKFDSWSVDLFLWSPEMLRWQQGWWHLLPTNITVSASGRRTLGVGRSPHRSLAISVWVPARLTQILQQPVLVVVSFRFGGTSEMVVVNGTRPPLWVWERRWLTNQQRTNLARGFCPFSTFGLRYLCHPIVGIRQEVGRGI